MNCDVSCQTCSAGASATSCLSCPLGTYLLSSNSSCVSCDVNGYLISDDECLQCDPTCLTCNGPLSINCLSCPSGTYFLASDNSCVACNVKGYFISGAECLESSKTTVQILKFELQYAPQLYLLSFDTPLDLENILVEIKLYPISNSAVPLISDMSEMSFTLTKVTASSYQLNFLSYTESSEIRSLLLSFDQFNSNSSYSYMISPSNSTALIFTDSTVAQAAAAVGTTTQVITIGTTTFTLLAYLQAKGASTQMMRFLQIMARINFMKLININYLTPLAAFYNYTDLGQFGMPNIFNKIPGYNNSQTPTNSTIKTDSQGHIIFNDYFKYSFSQVFLDNYGGIIFSTCTTLTLYLLVKVASNCFKNKNSKIKNILIAAGQSFEKSVFTTLLVSRYSYLCSALILNYVFIPTNGAYQQISSGLAILYTILMVFILILAICVSFYHGRNKAKLKPIRPLLRSIALLLRDYRSNSYSGRIMTFWTLLSNLLIILVLTLLRKWVIFQLSVLIALNAITILIAYPKNVFKATADKIVLIGTELGFILVAILFLVMYSLENSNLYQVRLGLSWTVIGVNVAIILFQIVVKIINFFRLRREKRRKERKQKQGSTQRANDGNQIQLQKNNNFDISMAKNPKGSWNRSRNRNDTSRSLK